MAKIDEEMVEKEILEAILLGIDFSGVPLEKKAARFSLARRAEEYIRGNLKGELSISDLCQTLGTSARTLHLGFIENFGISPQAYSQILQLNDVHKELLLNSFGNNKGVKMLWEWKHCLVVYVIYLPRKCKPYRTE